ncbi:hypothetical protein DPMN_084472 [Dreissena polymorpha]|uniref:Uncharacterized protein n=1 Tax=Dreissena polymorpha TaxID=45954 RepID=A0A9D3YAL2_DREPO|nr:hypothetical protein DPMN_084472 [Dreissena polymorpha]
MGEPVPSFPPWPAPNEEGDGVVLPCNYVINHSDIKASFSKLCASGKITRMFCYRSVN